MSFEIVPGQSRTAVDRDRSSRMAIKSGPQMEVMNITFSSPKFDLSTPIFIRRKFQDRPVITGSPSNPGIMLLSRNLNAAFERRRMYDLQYNTHLVDYVVRMIAFINKDDPMANAPFLWSDYPAGSEAPWLYRMPSDEELLDISLRPEADIGTGGQR